MEFSEEDSKGKEENEAVYPPYVNTAETQGYCTPEIVNTAETQGYCTPEIVNTAETQGYCTPQIDLKHDYEALRRETRTDNQHHTKPVHVISRWIKSYCAYVNLAILNVAMLGIIIFICLSKRNVGWTSWSSWDSCSHTCGEGVQSRSRSCNNPSDFGQLCAGDSLQIQPCKINRCLTMASAFSVSGPSAITNDRINFTGVIYQQGGDYDVSTGTFTCSLSGTYLFSVNLVKKRDVDRVYCLLYKSSLLHNSFIQLANIYIDPDDEYSDKGNAAVSSTIVTNLTKGDNVYLYGCTEPSSTMEEWSSFMGVLLHPD